MKLLPLQGIDGLMFGDNYATATNMLGQADRVRTHKDGYCRKTASFRKYLSLGFDANDNLVFIAVLWNGSDIELWGERPFESLRCSSDLRQWIERLGLRATPVVDSFGARLEIPTERVTFCFSTHEKEELESIQLDTK